MGKARIICEHEVTITEIWTIVQARLHYEKKTLCLPTINANWNKITCWRLWTIKQNKSVATWSFCFEWVIRKLRQWPVCFFASFYGFSWFYCNTLQNKKSTRTTASVIEQEDFFPINNKAQKLCTTLWSWLSRNVGQLLRILQSDIWSEIISNEQQLLPEAQRCGNIGGYHFLRTQFQRHCC